jgi:hypothetical protein
VKRFARIPLFCALASAARAAFLRELAAISAGSVPEIAEHVVRGVVGNAELGRA